MRLLIRVFNLVHFGRRLVRSYDENPAYRLFCHCWTPRQALKRFLPPLVIGTPILAAEVFGWLHYVAVNPAGRAEFAPIALLVLLTWVVALFFASFFNGYADFLHWRRKGVLEAISLTALDSDEIFAGYFCSQNAMTHCAGNCIILPLAFAEGVRLIVMGRHLEGAAFFIGSFLLAWTGREASEVGTLMGLETALRRRGAVAAIGLGFYGLTKLALMFVFMLGGIVATRLYVEEKTRLLSPRFKQLIAGDAPAAFGEKAFEFNPR